MSEILKMTPPIRRQLDLMATTAGLLPGNREFFTPGSWPGCDGVGGRPAGVQITRVGGGGGL